MMLHRILGISKSEQWENIGISCFPQVSSRDKFNDMCSEDEKRFILTRQEMEDPTNKWWKDIGETLRRHSPASHECYKAFASLMAGSVYVSSDSPTPYKQEFQKKHTQETLERIVGAGDINLPSVENTVDADETPKFKELKTKPLGSMLSIWFWNQDQLDTLYNLNSSPHTVIMVTSTFMDHG